MDALSEKTCLVRTGCYDTGWHTLKRMSIFFPALFHYSHYHLQVEDARAAMAIYRKYQRDWTEPLCLSDAFDPATRMFANLRLALDSVNKSPWARPKLGRNSNSLERAFSSKAS
jgi:hypothetical protein